MGWCNHVTFILRNKNNSNYIDYQKFSTINVILRKSARELEIEMQIIQSKISSKVKETKDEKPASRIKLSKEVELQFEKWRRGLK